MVECQEVVVICKFFVTAVNEEETPFIVRVLGKEYKLLLVFSHFLYLKVGLGSFYSGIDWEGLRHALFYCLFDSIDVL